MTEQDINWIKTGLKTENIPFEEEKEGPHTIIRIIHRDEKRNDITNFPIKSFFEYHTFVEGFRLAKKMIGEN